MNPERNTPDSLLAQQVGEALLDVLLPRVREIAEEVINAREGAGCVKVETAMRLLDMSEYRVRQLIREGKLKVVRPTPNTIRIPLSEIRRFSEGKS